MAVIVRLVTIRVLAVAVIVANIVCLIWLHEKGTFDQDAVAVTVDHRTKAIDLESSGQLPVEVALASPLDKQVAIASTTSNATPIQNTDKEASASLSRQAFTTLHRCQLHNKTVIIPTAPYLIIVGAQKAGTTSMTEWLNEHPQVSAGKYADRKESHFFQGIFGGLLAARKSGTWSGTDDEFYCWARQRFSEALYDVPNLMKGMVDGRNPVVTFDKTPAYLHLKDCPEYVAKTCPWGAKILVLLRNPVDRAFSQHEMDIAKNNHANPAFEDRLRSEVEKMRRIGLNDMPLVPVNATVQDVEGLVFPELTGTHEEQRVRFEKLKGMPLLKKGMYAIQLREWFKKIPRENIFLQFYEDLKRNPDDTFLKVQQFLGLQNYSLTKYAHSKAGNYTPMNQATRRYLERFFEPYNRQMEELLDEPMHPAWK